MKWLYALLLALACACSMPTDGKDGVDGANGTNGADGRDGIDTMPTAYVSYWGNLTLDSRTDMGGLPCWNIFVGDSLTAIIAVYVKPATSKYWTEPYWTHKITWGITCIRIYDDIGTNTMTDWQYRIDAIKAVRREDK